MKKIILLFMAIFLSGSVLFGAPLEEGQTITSVTLEPSTLKVGDTGTVRVTFDIPTGLHQSYIPENFTINVPDIPGLTWDETQYPEGVEEKGFINFYGKVVLTRSFKVEKAPEALSFVVTARHQLCEDSGVCYMPIDENHIVPLNIEGAGEANLLEILQFLLMAFLGGLLLNIMPCVLPVLSIKALSLVNQSQDDKKSIFKGSLFYTAGILVSFIILAAVVIALKLSGELVGWGFQFQNPGFVIGLTAVIFIFSLSLFDVFVITAPGMNLATKASSKKGHAGSFFTGIFAVVLATPCTAPFLGAALGFAFSQPPFIILGIFLMVGLGLSLPFILIGIKPGFVKKIPKPGEWMNIFKEAMGFLLLGTALWLLDVLYHQIGGNVIRVLMFLLSLGLGAWILGRFAPPGSTTKRSIITWIIVLAVTVTGGIVTLDFDQNNTGISENGTELREGWEEFSPELVTKYREQNIPVFIDFNAKWCMTCKVNEASTLFTPEMDRLFEEYGVKPLAGDYTNKDPVIDSWIKKFERAGVPVYVLYIPGEEEPYLFPEILNMDMIKDVFAKRLSPGGPVETIKPGKPDTPKPAFPGKP